MSIEIANGDRDIKMLLWRKSLGKMVYEITTNVRNIPERQYSSDGRVL